MEPGKLAPKMEELGRSDNATRGARESNGRSPTSYLGLRVGLLTRFATPVQTCWNQRLAQTWPRHRFSQNSGRIAPCPATVMCGKEVGMSPRQQPASSRHKNDGNADSAAEPRAPLTISTRQIFLQISSIRTTISSPANSGDGLHLKARVVTGLCPASLTTTENS